MGHDPAQFGLEPATKRQKYGADMVGRTSKKERRDFRPFIELRARTEGLVCWFQGPQIPLRSESGITITTWTPDAALLRRRELAGGQAPDGVRTVDIEGTIYDLVELWDCKAFDRKTKKYRLTARFRMIRKWILADYDLEIRLF